MNTLAIVGIILAVIFVALGGIGFFMYANRLKFEPFAILKAPNVKDLDDKKYVRAVHLSLLGREPDSKELSDGLAKIKSGNRESLRVQVVGGPKFRALYPTDNKAFARHLYRSILRRDPESNSATESWATQIGQTSRASVVNEFLQSPEYMQLTRA